MKQRTVMIAALSAGLLLAACASSPEQTTEDILSKRGYAVAERVERIKNYRINGWNYVDDRHVIFGAGPRDNYLVTLTMDCTDLRGAEHIGFTTTTDDVTPFDQLVVKTSIGPRKCPIESLHQLERVKAESCSATTRC